MHERTDSFLPAQLGLTPNTFSGGTWSVGLVILLLSGTMAGSPFSQEDQVKRLMRHVLKRSLEAQDWS